ncbi:hypothetical protein BHE74_00043102 [Ensete ventricosum]|nr:hypothetical protein BHE74_00043102 [Ensete ventricosum]RZR80957.1 hypothetical protein BHM03_00007085 [Ensete ventricosum]
MFALRLIHHFSPITCPCSSPRAYAPHNVLVLPTTLATDAHAITATWCAMPSHHASALTDPPYGVKAERTVGLPPVSIKPPLGGTGKGLLTSTTISTS